MLNAFFDAGVSDVLAIFKHRVFDSDQPMFAFMAMQVASAVIIRYLYSIPSTKNLALHKENIGDNRTSSEACA